MLGKSVYHHNNCQSIDGTQYYFPAFLFPNVETEKTSAKENLGGTRISNNSMILRKQGYEWFQVSIKVSEKLEF